MRKSREGFPVEFLLPALLLAALVWLVPLIYSVALSFTDATPGAKGAFIGLANYLRALTSAQFANSIFVSLVYAFGATIFGVILGFGIAAVLMPHPKAKAVAQSALLLPWILAELAVALIWGSFLSEGNGLINTALASFGVPSIPFFSSSGGAMSALWLANLWRGLALSVMLQMTGLASLPSNLIHAAQIDGAPWHQILRDVLWPHQWRFIAINAMLVFLMAAVSFSLPFALTSGGPLFSTELVALFAYRTGFSGYFELGYAAAQGMIVLIAYGVLALLLLRIRRKMA